MDIAIFLSAVAGLFLYIIISSRKNMSIEARLTTLERGHASADELRQRILSDLAQWKHNTMQLVKRDLNVEVQTVVNKVEMKRIIEKQLRALVRETLAK